MASTFSYLSLLFAVTVILHRIRSWVIQRRANPSQLPYPPGPKSLPLIGNLLDMPNDYYWVTYAKWSKQYDEPIIHIEVFGQHFIVLDTLETCLDLLEKRSAIYSDRPRLPMMNELMSFTWAFSLMPYGDHWRRHRKVFHQYFYPNAALKYTPNQLIEARKTLVRLLNHPEGFMEHIRMFFAASILDIVYGIKVDETKNRFFMDVSEKVMEGATIAGVPGAFLVDVLPFLKYVPSWFPGAGFKKTAKVYSDLMPTLVNAPIEFIQGEVNSQREHKSIVAEHYKRLQDSGFNEYEDLVTRNIAAIAYAAGADTTVSTLQVFFLAMRLYPEVQRKAQAQIDEAVGTTRLPEFSDIENLPYIQAVVLELFRWQPITPLAVAHRVVEDDTYRGYHIPKGAIITGNVWAILYNEDVYPDPETFKPERFLKSDGTINQDVLDPRVASFGFGRRICPGRHLAYNGALIMAAYILAVFNIQPPLGERCESNGTHRKGQPLMTSGLIAHPLPFSCRIMPRSSEAAALLNNFEQD